VVGDRGRGRAPKDAAAVERLAAFVTCVRKESLSPAALADRRAAYTMERVADRVHRALCEVSDGR
jgi:hypothetical protein